MNSIIEVKNLGKKYDLGKLPSAPYVVLRDSLSNVIKSPARWMKRKVKTAMGLETKNELWALKDVNFTVEQGEVLGIIGRNGAGKSTMLKILSRITPPTTGEIRLRGRVGSLLEVGTGFHQELSGRENIYLNGAILGMRTKEIDKKFDQIVEFSGVAKFLAMPVKRYSSGMQVRLAFSVAAHLEPEILIIDEVLAVGDVEFQKKCLGKMEEVTKKEGRTVLFVSHNMGAVRALCTKCLWLDGGQLKTIGETNSIIGDYLNSRAQSAVVEVTADQHNKGSGDAVITKAEIRGEDESPKTSFAVSEKIKILADYEVKNNVKPISFGIIFYDNEGSPLISSFQKDGGGLITPRLGKNNIQIEFSDVGLVPGRYTISLSIISHDGSEYDYADWVDNCFTIDVSGEFFNGRRFDNRPGRLNKQATWLY